MKTMMFCPYTGRPRHPDDIKSDPQGLLLIEPGEPIMAAEMSTFTPDVKTPSEPSPTAGMNMAQRILHVGGRNNAAGYVEFGSVQAVQALVRQFVRDMPPTVQAQPVPRVIANIKHDKLGHPYAAMLTAYDSEGNGLKEGTALVLASATPAPQAKPQPVIESNMFWDHEDLEDFGHSIGDIVCNYGPGDKVKIDCAFRMQTVTVLVKEGGDYEIVSGSTTHPSKKAQPLSDAKRTQLRDALAQALGSTYVCDRVWSAWQHGTMTEDDFTPAAECDELLTELVAAVESIKE